MASLEVMINAANDDYVPVIPARTESTRIDKIQDAENLKQLFDLLERLKADKLSIKDFIDITRQPSKGEIFGSYNAESLKQDLCGPNIDLKPLATKILARVKSTVLDVHSQENELDVPDFVQYDALLKVEQQLLDSSVYICVVGRYNVGKTTLINALIGEDVLPVSISPETAITLYIQHDDKVEQSLDSGNSPQPRLIKWSNSLPVATGIQNIKQHLSDLHHGIRDRIIMPRREDYLLKIEFPILQTQGNPKPYLVDTPGSNEVGEGDLQKISDLNLKSAAAYIFVMKYDDIKNKEDYEAFKTIYERDPQIFQSERLTIVVTHYDTYFQNYQAQLSAGDVKKTIASTLTKVLHLEVSENIVFPICGKWASDARLCKSCSANGNYNDIQMGLMNVEMKKSRMTFGEASVRVNSMLREDVLRDMERISLIAELEERIDMVSKRLAVIWRQNIISSCKGFLKAGKDLMEHLESKYAKKVEETEYQTLYAQKVVDHHTAMLDSISDESAFLAELKTSYEDDTKYEGKFKNKVDELLEELQTILLEKQRQRKYGIQQLKEDINQKFYADAETKMKRWLLQTKFIRCQRLLHRYTQRVSEKFGRLRSAAASAVERGGFAPTLAGHSNPFGDDDLEDIGDKMEDTLTNLKKCELSEIITQTHWIRMKLPLLRANVIKDDNLGQLVEERQQAIETQHREFFERMKDEVILYFFKTYCNVVVKELILFITLIEEHGQIIQLQQLNERKKELSDKKQKKARYSLLKEHFAKLSIQLQFVEP